MATTRKTSAKKAVTKKKAAPAAASISMGVIPKMHLSMPLDAKKIAAIHRCIEKGTLTVKLTKVDLIGGKLGGGWLYD